MAMRIARIIVFTRLLLPALACSGCSRGPCKNLGRNRRPYYREPKRSNRIPSRTFVLRFPPPVSKSAGLRVRTATATPHAECDDRDGAADQCPDDEEQGAEGRCRCGKDLDGQRPDRRLSRSVQGFDLNHVR